MEISVRIMQQPLHPEVQKLQENRENCNMFASQTKTDVSWLFVEPSSNRQCIDKKGRGDRAIVRLVVKADSKAWSG